MPRSMKGRLSRHLRTLLLTGWYGTSLPEPRLWPTATADAAQKGEQRDSEGMDLERRTAAAAPD